MLGISIELLPMNAEAPSSCFYTQCCDNSWICMDPEALYADQVSSYMFLAGVAAEATSIPARIL